MSDTDWRAGFESDGTEFVRLRLSRVDGDGGYQDGAQRGAAIKWLAQKDEASKAEQIEIGRSAKDAAREGARSARTANRIALAALFVAVMALLVSIGSVLIQVDDLKLMITNKPLMGGNHQEVTVSTGTLMTFINMGKRPISITSVGFFLVETDQTGKPLHSDQVKQIQVQPFIVKAGEIITKELRTSDSPLTFKPTATTGSETISLQARFALVTPNGSTFAPIDPSDFSLPASGTSYTTPSFTLLGPPGATQPLSPPTTLYHNWSVAPPW